jgi:hypothetical protein
MSVLRVHVGQARGQAAGVVTAVSAGDLVEEQSPVWPEVVPALVGKNRPQTYAPRSVQLRDWVVSAQPGVAGALLVRLTVVGVGLDEQRSAGQSTYRCGWR